MSTALVERIPANASRRMDGHRVRSFSCQIAVGTGWIATGTDRIAIDTSRIAADTGRITVGTGRIAAGTGQNSSHGAATGGQISSVFERNPIGIPLTPTP